MLLVFYFDFLVIIVHWFIEQTFILVHLKDFTSWVEHKQSASSAKKTNRLIVDVTLKSFFGIGNLYVKLQSQQYMTLLKVFEFSYFSVVDDFF